MFTHVAARMTCWPPTRPFQEVLQSIRYLLNRPLCFRLEREFRRVGLSPTDQPRLTKAHTTTRPRTRSGRSRSDEELALRGLAVGRRVRRCPDELDRIGQAQRASWAYLKDVFERLPTLKNRDLAQLLPHNWRPASAIVEPGIVAGGATA